MKIISSAVLAAAMLLFVAKAANSATDCSFTAGTQNGEVCDVTVQMHPVSPASTAAITLTGANSGGFHLVGPGCSNISLGRCTIQQSSAVGGTPSGTYVDATAVATQSGIVNSPFTQQLTLTGTGAPVIVAISSSPASFTAQSGNANSTVGTLSATVSSNSFGGGFALGTGSGCTSTNNSSFVIVGDQLKIGTGDITTAATYSICVRATDPAFSNSPKLQTVTLTGQAPGACSGTQVITDAASYAPGAPITVTTCGGAGNPQDWVILGNFGTNFGGEFPGPYYKYLGVNTPGATVTLASPNAKYDRDLVAIIRWYSNGSHNLIATSAPFILQKSISPAAPTASLPSSEAADPFVPDHVISVCASGCNFTSLGDATDAATGSNWDNVEIKVSSGEYEYPTKRISGRYPPHLWIKGIGTTMPHFWGTAETTGSIIGDMNYNYPGSGASLTIDNLELGPWPGWIMATIDARTVTLRNDYFHDGAQGYITGNSTDFTGNFYNVYFARSGTGNGPEHNVYIGEGNLAANGNTINVKNSVFEQANAGHNFKTRAIHHNSSCSLYVKNEDDVWLGSEDIDLNGGQPTLTNNVFVSSGGAPAGWTSINSWDSIRYAVDEEPPTPPLIPVVNNNVFLSDDPLMWQWFFTFGDRMANPPVTFSGNTFVWHDAGHRDGPNAGHSDVDPTGALDVIHVGVITDITLDNSNHLYNDRASAGLPAIGTFPKGYRDYLFLMPAACTDPVGLVKVPPS